MEHRPMFDGKTLPLVSGRECGECNVCCVDLTIDDPALQKPQGVRCPNAMADNGCAIYDSRPDTCRTFFCGWRMLRWVKPTLRPDTSGVLVTLTYHDKTSRMLQPGEIDSRALTGVMFCLLREEGLDADGLAESVAAAVASGTIVHFSVPGPPGLPSAIVRIDESLKPAVQNRDKTGLLNALRAAWREGRKEAFETAPLSGQG
jgi:hypothetical protein